MFFLAFAIPVLLDAVITAAVTTVAVKAASDLYDSVIRDDEPTNQADV